MFNGVFVYVYLYICMEYTVFFQFFIVIYHKSISVLGCLCSFPNMLLFYV